MGDEPPTDSADACYMAHDKGWDKCKGKPDCKTSCDRDLFKCLEDLGNDPTKWPQPPPSGTEGDSRAYRARAMGRFDPNPLPPRPGRAR